jgi:hypothetical protein
MNRQTGLVFRPMDLCESADRQGEGSVVGGKRAQRDRQKRFLLMEPVFKSKESWAEVLGN